MSDRSCLAIVLAAGEGTRMRSQRPKVLHEVAGRSLLAHVLAAVRAAGGTATAVVIGPGAEAVAAEATRMMPGAEMFMQPERRGRRAGHLRRYAADPAADARADARGARQGCGCRCARLPPARSDGLWAP